VIAFSLAVVVNIVAVVTATILVVVGAADTFLFVNLMDCKNA